MEPWGCVDNRRVARLDRGLCNMERRHNFSMASVKQLTHSYSDRCPPVIAVESRVGSKARREATQVSRDVVEP